MTAPLQATVVGGRLRKLVASIKLKSTGQKDFGSGYRQGAHANNPRSLVGASVQSSMVKVKVKVRRSGPLCLLPSVFSLASRDMS